MDISDELGTFCDALHAGCDMRQTNILLSAVRPIIENREYLLIICERFRDASEGYRTRCLARIEAAKREPAGPRAVTQAEFDAMLRESRVAHVIKLDIKSFFVFAKVLLDKLAQLIFYYFG